MLVEANRYDAPGPSVEPFVSGEENRSVDRNGHEADFALGIGDQQQG